MRSGTPTTPAGSRADELRPAEAISAIGVAGLALRRKDQHRLPVFVLQAEHRMSAQHRHIVLDLPAGMRVERAPRRRGRLGEHIARRGRVEQLRDGIEYIGRQHVPMREG